MRAAIELRGVGKRYQKLEQSRTLLGSLVPFNREARHELWALQDLNLEVAPGETVGVLGQNGAGKTTLLRLLAGVTRPTVGRVRVEGRIGPLISLGVGFAQEMSGRENVLVNGMLLGLSASEVQSRFDQIVEFAGLERFIDTPVKFYSSGMLMRLGFGVIAHINPTILLVDEILAVGDARFQLKCFERLRNLQAEGATILMVSHSMHMLRELCDRALLIRHGRLVFDGEVEEAVSLHRRGLVDDQRRESGPVQFVVRRFTDTGTEWRRAVYDEPVELELRLRFNQFVEDPVVAVGVITNSGLFAGFDATAGGRSWRTFNPGQEATVRIKFRARLGGGTYRIIIDVKDRVGADTLARTDDLILTVTPRDGSSGLADVCAEVELTESRVPHLEGA